MCRSVFGDDQLISQSTVYIALSTTTPTVSAGVVTGGVTEPSGGSYARASVANDDTNFGTTDGVASNLTEIEFPEATADWGTVTHAVLYTASSGGTALGVGTLSLGGTAILTGNTPTFDPGQLTLTVT